MFRIRVSDKFHHVLSRLQALVASNYKACTPVLLPKYVILEDIDQNVEDKVRAKLDSVYHEKEITVVVSFKQSNSNDISLKGVAKRSWERPTLEYDDAFQHGIGYKGFTLPLATTNCPSIRNNGRFNNICEVLHISVTNLQKKMTAEAVKDGYLWYNWIQTLPSPFEHLNRNVVLPDWMSERSVKEACKTIVETRHLVKLARENGRDYEPNTDIPPLEFAQDLLGKTEESIKAMKITNNFYNIVKIKQKGEKVETSNDDKDIDDKEAKKRRARVEQRMRNDEEHRQRENQYRLRE